MTPVIKVIIPVYNEQDSIGLVLNDIPSTVQEIIVVNNGSTDETALIARDNGATVLQENQKGYGNACLKGLDFIATSIRDNQENYLQPDIVVFLDGDYSDYPEELTKIVTPIINEGYDMVIGARDKRFRESGSMTTPQIFGNWLATTLMSIFFNSTFTDLGPFRAMKYNSLLALNMEDKTYGWTVEMQLKVLKKNMRYTEVPVTYRNRIGVSKISGSIKGAMFAGFKILGWIFKYSLKK